MTTYGALMAGASQDVRNGAQQLRAEPFWSSTEGEAALREYHGALDGIASHVRRLVWTARMAPPEVTRYRTDLTAGETAARDLARGIEALVGEERPHPSLIRPPSTPWGLAAQRIRAASDLVATHFEPSGLPRSPDSAAAADPLTRRAALVDVANLAGAVLAVEEPLALRALQAGISQRAVLVALPGPSHLTQLARAAAVVDPDVLLTPPKPLGRLPQTTVRAGADEPLADLENRMLRLRAAAWCAIDDHRHSLAILRDLSAAGVAVHAHAARFHGAEPVADLSAEASTRRQADRFLTLTRHWQQQHAALANFLTLEPAPIEVREDVLATARVLELIAPLEPRCSAAPSDASRDGGVVARATGAALNGAVEVMSDVARYCGAAFGHLVRQHRLLIDSRSAPREIVAEDVQLVDARLRGAVVIAPQAMTDAVATANRQLEQGPRSGRRAPESRMEREARKEASQEPLSYVRAPA